MGRLLALLATLIAAAVVAWAGQRPPGPLPVSAPAASFSATRAMLDVQAIGEVPHPIQSPANLAVRDYLLGRMMALGLDPRIYRGTAVETARSRGVQVLAGGSVENLVGVLPGRDRAAPAVVLMAHYDSVAGSPGAADDAAGVASTLEIVRALKTGGVPARDVVVLITDGEEAGLLGARAFFASAPLASHFGFVLNMETRGAGGRVQMFQTGPRSGGAVAVLRRTATDPQASSLSAYIYERMPNDTDFTISRKADVDGLNFAFIGRQFDYHSPTATPRNLDRGSLQDMGQQVLGVARAVAFAPALPARTANPVYSQVLGGLVVAYPTSMGWLVLAAAAVLLAAGILRARRVEAFAWTDMARGAGAALFAVVGGAAVLHFARRATGAAFGFLEQRYLLAQAVRWEICVILLGLGFLILAAAELARGRRAVALVPLLAGIGACLLGDFDPAGLGLGAVAAVLAILAYGRPVSRAGAWAGVLILGLVGAAAMQVLAPPAAYILAWPLLLACLAAAAGALSVRRSSQVLVGFAVVSALGLAWIGGLAHVLFLGLDLVEVLALPVFIASLLIWPLAQPDEGAPPARLVGPALLLAGLAVLLSVRLNHPYDARHPEVGYVAYQIDQDAGRAWRLSPRGGPAWTGTVLKSGGAPITQGSRWWMRQPLSLAPAPFIARPAPPITLTAEADGSLRLHALPPPGARLLNLRLTSSVPAMLETVGGAPALAALHPGVATIVHWETATDGLDLVLRPKGRGSLNVAYAAIQENWPPEALPLPPRPPNVMAFDTSDSTMIAGTRRFDW